MSKPLTILGSDPSFSNWGMVKAIFQPSTGLISINWMDVARPIKPKGKTVRQNSLDLDRAKQLSKAFIEASRGVDLIAVEVPHGSQSARAMASYGVCVGILGCMLNTQIPIIQVNAIETRKVITGRKDATKEQAIAWAMSKHPEAPWPMHHGAVNTSLAEHMADAIAAIYAAMDTETFKTMAMLAKKG